MDLGLDGHGVLVTGGAGGIGSATVRAFAAEGARVAVHHLTSGDRARDLADEVDGVAVHGDLRDEGAVDRVVGETVDGLGRLDVCVANAGVWPREDVPVADMPLERWEATIASNLTATFLTARAFLRHALGMGGGGALVLVASTAGVFGEAGHADYAAAKSAIAHGLLRSLKNEAAPVRVNAVAPGWTVSPMTDRDVDPETVERATATMPLRKVAAADDVAAAIVWLASPVAAGHLTGEVVTIAGGMEGRLLHPPG